MSFASEVSVVVAKGADGRSLTYPVGLNRHERHILDSTVMPAPVGPAVSRDARELALGIAQALGTVGVLTVEFFVTASGDLLVNELAPSASQLGPLDDRGRREQPVRAASSCPLRPAAGRDRPCQSRRDGQPAGRPLAARGTRLARGPCARDPGVKLHLYGKRTPAPGRKMGHLTVLDPDPETALARARAAGVPSPRAVWTDRLSRIILRDSAPADRGPAVRLAEPQWLIFLVLALLPWLRARSLPRLAWPTLTAFASHGGTGWLATVVPGMLTSAAILCLVVAMARPQTVAGQVRVAGQGTAIVVALDRSSSMTTRDFPAASGRITRIEAARRTVEDFALGRPDDWSGSSTVANFPDTACPPTLDHEFLAAEARGLKTASGLDDGTNLGDAIAWSLHELEACRVKRAKVLILLTDGRHDPGVPHPLDPQAAARLAGEMEIALHASPSAARGGALRPIEPTTGLEIPTEVPGPDLDLLARLAALGGGRSFVAADAAALDEVFREIDRLETSPVTGTIRTRYRERPPLALTALASLHRASSCSWVACGLP